MVLGKMFFIISNEGSSKNAKQNIVEFNRQQLLAIAEAVIVIKGMHLNVMSCRDNSLPIGRAIKVNEENCK